MVLLYHLIFPDNTPKSAWNAGSVLRMSHFKRQIDWLRRHFEILRLEEYLSLYHQDPRKLKRKLAITFDDGYRSVIDLVAPFFESEGIPATFFCNTRHFERTGLLWFVYLNGLCSERSYDSITLDGREHLLTTKESALETWRMLINSARESGNPIGFTENLAERYPLPEEVLRKYAGVTREQLMMIANSKVLSLGGHTHNHPYLDQLTLDDQVQEMAVNKQILEDLTQNKISMFAYTGGVYNRDSLAAVRSVGFDAAFAVTPKNIGGDMLFEFPRTDIYSPSLLKLTLRISNVPSNLMRLARRLS